MGQGESTPADDEANRSFSSVISGSFKSAEAVESTTSMAPLEDTAASADAKDAAADVHISVHQPALEQELADLRTRMAAGRLKLEQKLELLEEQARTQRAGEVTRSGAAIPPAVVTARRWVAVLADEVCKQGTLADSITQEELAHQLMAALHDLILQCPS